MATRHPAEPTLAGNRLYDEAFGHGFDEGRASALSDLPAMLAAIPSFPRPLLSRLTARLIQRLDEIDGDPDAEDDDAAEEGGDMENEQDGWATIGDQWGVGTA